jgi:hypothetical protein
MASRFFFFFFSPAPPNERTNEKKIVEFEFRAKKYARALARSLARCI